MKKNTIIAALLAAVGTVIIYAAVVIFIKGQGFLYNIAALAICTFGFMAVIVALPNLMPRRRAHKHADAKYAAYRRKLLRQRAFALFFIICGAIVLAINAVSPAGDIGSKDGTAGIIFLVIGVLLMFAKKIYIF